MATDVYRDQTPASKEDCCLAGQSAFADLSLARELVTDPESDVNLKDLHYRQRRVEVAFECARLGAAGQCLLADECMMDRFPKPESD